MGENGKVLIENDQLMMNEGNVHTKKGLESGGSNTNYDKEWFSKESIL